jgi:hypothetical protein
MGKRLNATGFKDLYTLSKSVKFLSKVVKFLSTFCQILSNLVRIYKDYGGLLRAYLVKISKIVNIITYRLV